MPGIAREMSRWGRMIYIHRRHETEAWSDTCGVVEGIRTNFECNLLVGAYICMQEIFPSELHGRGVSATPSKSESGCQWFALKGVGDGNNHIKTRSSEPKQTSNSRRLFFAGRVD